MDSTVPLPLAPKYVLDSVCRATMACAAGVEGMVVAWGDASVPAQSVAGAPTPADLARLVSDADLAIRSLAVSGRGDFRAPVAALGAAAVTAGVVATLTSAWPTLAVASRRRAFDALAVQLPVVAHHAGAVAAWASASGPSGAVTVGAIQAAKDLVASLSGLISGMQSSASYAAQRAELIRRMGQSLAGSAGRDTDEASADIGETALRTLDLAIARLCAAVGRAQGELAEIGLGIARMDAALDEVAAALARQHAEADRRREEAKSKSGGLTHPGSGVIPLPLPWSPSGPSLPGTGGSGLTTG